MKQDKLYGYTKAQVIELLGLRRVSRYSDSKRVWISASGKEFETLAQAALTLPKKDVK